jgi:hypothetical protein
MGLTDKLKDLKTQAEGAVVQHSDKIHEAVEKVATTADKTTGGKYTDKIQKAGTKADSLVSGIGADAQSAPEEPAAEAEPEAKGRE